MKKFSSQWRSSVAREYCLHWASFCQILWFPANQKGLNYKAFQISLFSEKTKLKKEENFWISKYLVLYLLKNLVLQLIVVEKPLKQNKKRWLSLQEINQDQRWLSLQEINQDQRACALGELLFQINVLLGLVGNENWQTCNEDTIICHLLNLKCCII